MRSSLFGNEDDGAPESAQSDGDSGIMSSVKNVINLKWRDRIIGFVICLVVAIVLVALGCFLATISLAAFAILFTLGTIIAILSTLFLVGPITQAKKFVDFSNIPEAVIRIIAAITVIAAVILAIVCAALKLPVLAVILAVVQFIALIVYSITLIPFAMTGIVKFFKVLFAAAG